MPLKTWLFTAAIGASTFALSAPALAQDAMSAEEQAALAALDAAVPGTFLHNPLLAQWTDRGSDMKMKVVDSEGLDAGQAISLRVKKAQANPWDTALVMDMDEGIAAGETVQVLYWIRTAKAPKGEAAAQVDLFVGRNEDPYDNVIAGPVSVGPDWQMQSVKGTAGSDIPAGKLKVEYQLGRAAQTVEIGPIYVSKL